MQDEKRLPRRAPGKKSFLPAWFRACAVALLLLIVLKALQLEVFLEIQLGGVPYLTALTETETWFIPLGLLLIYILWNWLWRRFFGSRES